MDIKIYNIKNKHARRIAIIALLAALIVFAPIVIIIAFAIFLGGLLKDNFAFFYEELSWMFEEWLEFGKDVIKQSWHDDEETTEDNKD